MVNPNWPRLLAEWAPTGHIGYGSSWGAYEDMPWVDVTARRLIQAWSTNRGRQYETNQNQTGTLTTVWDNRDAAFDPSNTSSVFYPNVAPYRAIRLRAQYPPGGVNLATVDQATSGEAGLFGPGASPSMFGIDISGFFTEWQVVASTTAYQGTQVCELTLANGTTANSPEFYTRFSVIPNTAYSYTYHVRCTTTGQNPQVYPAIQWYTPTGTLISTATGSTVTLTGGSGTWATVTVSGTAPATAGYCVVGVNTAAAITTNTQLQGDGLQWEANASPSAFSIPNPWYPIFTGGVERYPQIFTHKGAFGQTPAASVDTFALLSQSILPDPLTAAIFTPAGGSAPTFAYKLADPNGSSSFADSTGNRSPAQAVNSKNGAGTITPGTQQTSATTAGKFLGSSQTVTNISSSAAAGTNLYGQPMSWISPAGNANGVVGPAAGTGLNFTRMIAFRCTGSPSSQSTIWTSQNPSNVNELSVFINSFSQIVIAVNDANHTGVLAIGTLDLNNWHLAWLGVTSDGTSFIAGMDGSIVSYNAPPSALTFAGGFSTDQIGATPVNNDPTTAVFNYQGDVAFAVEWPFVLSSAQVSAIYSAWRTAFSGDSSGQRYSRILGWAGWTGPTAIDAGSSTSLGPATNIAGTDALSALQAVVDTEAGNHFVDAAGRLTFKGRADRYNKTTPSVIFGAGPPFGASGELPFTDLSFDSDPSLICNLAQVTQQSTGQVFTAQDATSQTNNGVRTRTITNLSTSATECQAQASYVVSRYKTNTQRIKSITFEPGGNPVLWQALLSLEIGARARAIMRPPGVPATSLDVFVENIAWKGDDGAKAAVTLQCSPADLTPYGVFAALHTKLNVQANSGASSITLNALSDAALNPAASQLYVGQSLTLAPGTAAAQTVTVTSVANTSPGYSTVAVGISPNASSTFAAGATVCEALPASSVTTYTNNGATYTPPGPTAPTKWDSTTFGNVNFAY